MLLLFALCIFAIIFSTHCHVIHPPEEADDPEHPRIHCSDITVSSMVGKILLQTSTNEPINRMVDFWIASNNHRHAVKILSNDWPELGAFNSSSFDPTRKTVIIIHGYKSAGSVSWVIGMKEHLLAVKKRNVIIVDWSDSSHLKNYVNAARNLEIVARRILHFLYLLKAKLKGQPGKHRWNQLHFVGHSLGAQMSGITAHLLKSHNYFTVKRITGLDPAQPCFKGVHLSLRLDKEDAEFVDVIHTQTGKRVAGVEPLGLRERAGHVDFYVNSGVNQLACKVPKLYPLAGLTKMMCSHGMAHKYFIESMANLITKKDCKFLSYPWDGSYESALKAANNARNNHRCANCPLMGIEASKTGYLGMLIVFAGREEPYCEYDKEKDVDAVLRMIQKIEDPLDDSDIFN
ncbi:hypothetical protein TKK_0018370 [Trichogramma kaykai]